MFCLLTLSQRDAFGRRYVATSWRNNLGGCPRVNDMLSFQEEGTVFTSIKAESLTYLTQGTAWLKNAE
ncbi:MAG: hypothetical protein CVT94_02000 [Bacteroidetes bacterium HGW-Bacteroidetes-11]|nr:MAG: hypothetical protein CVT94_02000 [Bacteroidetes bacterium HGW-Bacteroidetes-11]